MLGALRSFDFMLRLTILVALCGGLIVAAFYVAEAINDPPRTGAASADSLENYQDRARWFSAMRGIGQAGIGLALPLGLVTLALARKD